MERPLSEFLLEPGRLDDDEVGGKIYSVGKRAGRADDLQIGSLEKSYNRRKNNRCEEAISPLEAGSRQPVLPGTPGINRVARRGLEGTRKDSKVSQSVKRERGNVP